jgi:hypothetical protein
MEAGSGIVAEHHISGFVLQNVAARQIWRVDATQKRTLWNMARLVIEAPSGKPITGSGKLAIHGSGGAATYNARLCLPLLF